MLTFKHLNLDVSEAEYKGHKIQVRVNSNRDWELWLDGKTIEGVGPFDSRRRVIDYVNEKIAKIDPAHAAKLEAAVKLSSTNGNHQPRPKQNGGPKPCTRCGSKTFPHRCMKISGDKISVKRIR